MSDELRRVQETHAAEMAGHEALAKMRPGDGATEEDWQRFREKANEVLALSATARETTWAWVLRPLAVESA